VKVSKMKEPFPISCAFETIDPAFTKSSGVDKNSLSAIVDSLSGCRYLVNLGNT
jgi:hypothetical protein